MRERIALANERPEAKKLHGREQAMFALVDRARRRRRRSRWRAATSSSSASRSICCCSPRRRKASGDAAAIDEARRLKASLGLHDRRIDALL